MQNTHWSQPKTNIFAGIKDLSKALKHGMNAILIKEWNENCQYPIRIKNIDNDFRSYSFSHGTLSTRVNILNNKNMNAFEKSLSLIYKNCYGSREAVDLYYKTGKITMDNVRGMGVSHLVKVSDLVKVLIENNEDGSNTDRIDMFTKQYITMETAYERHFYDFFNLSRENSKWNVKKFKKKLWVVVLLNDKDEKPKQPFLIKTMMKIFNVIGNILKFIPVKSVFRMSEYTLHGWRIGGIINGFKVEIQIPKKFSFK